MAAEVEVGGVVGGFRVDGLVGRGGMGVVFRATQLSLDRAVALKVVAPDLAVDERFRERFAQEARLAASLEHPHLLPVYEAGEEDGVLFLAMKLVEGISLADALAAEGRLAPERAAILVQQLAGALEVAHAAGLVHRDVKPANVLVTEVGGAEHAFLCDFGLSRRVAGGTALTRPDGFVGTAAYAAPEQIRGEPVDDRADVYSLGCLLFECLTGRRPFAHDDELAVMWAHMHDPPPRPSEVDPALAGFDAVVGRALAKDPVARFPSASDLTRAVREGFAGTGPVARPGPAAPVKLPHPPTPFLGRERELQDVVELLLGEDVRLVTLTGPGGTGKTRLALRAAEEAAPAFPEGVYWVGLATLRDPDLVLETIARALGAKHGAVEELMGRRALLLLDNFEQVVEAASSLASLLDACPDLSVLVTSRETLRVHAELEYQVPPLETEEAVTLFCRRARQEPSETVAELCRRLDNLPLAVELAAARAKALSPTQILERLSSRLDLLKGGRDADPRQETLRATIDWSYDLLAPDEQQLFRRLSVFAGGCVLEAAEEVCGADVDTMQSLLEKSLLRLADERYWMLETIREYGASRLETTAESAAVHGRHLTYVLDLALDADARMTGSEQSRQLTRVEVEHANVRRALAWGVENDPERALRLAVALQRYFYVHGHSAEGLRALELALEGAPDAPPQLRARALRAAGSLAGGIGDVVRGRAYLESSLEPLRNLSDRRELAVALNNLGAVASRQADVDGARAFLVESLELKRELGDRHGTAMSLSNLGMVEAKASNLEVARASQEEALATFRELGDESAIINSLIALAEVSLLREERVQARALLDEALLLSEGIGDRAAAVEALALVARVALADGDGATARDAAGQAAEHASALDDDAYTIVVALEAAADVFVDQEALTQAVGLRATAARVRAESGMAPWPVERRQSDRTLERARDLLPPDVYARASAAGSSSPTDDALALAASLA